MRAVQTKAAPSRPRTTARLSSSLGRWPATRASTTWLAGTAWTSWWCRPSRGKVASHDRAARSPPARRDARLHHQRGRARALPAAATRSQATVVLHVAGRRPGNRLSVVAALGAAEVARSAPFAEYRPAAALMANGRNPKRRGHDTSRDPGGFVALPWSVLDSRAYLGLSHPARALLLELARQLHGDDNGRLLLSRAHLLPRGWKSADVLQRAKQELLDAELVFETVKGQRPNKASWYAVTWHRLGKQDGFDHGAAR